ncbi:MAG: hypothetical protein ACTHLA_05180 [Asticcacaulis sp.]|uniref:hypothetical protein n=1 Tax=Asticcacaulis sp. TaxID=1872648 RepID=UPI003F7CC3E5
MNYIRHGLVILVIGLVCADCATRGWEGETGDPIADARSDFSHGHEELLAVNGVRLEIPGVKGDVIYTDKVVQKFGVQLLKSPTSRSIDYGTKYNMEKLRLWGCDIHKPLGTCVRN